MFSQPAMPGLAGSLVPVCALLLLAGHAAAMDLPHHDVESLAYISTDIVTARLSVDFPAQVHGNRVREFIRIARARRQAGHPL